MAVTQQDIKHGLRELGLGRNSHVLVHSSFKSFGGVEGGPLTVVRALIGSLGTVMMPASTWRSLVRTPEPAARAGNGQTEAVVPFSDDLPISETMGVIPETFRKSFPVRRSSHPLQSFVSYGKLSDLLAGPRDDTNVVDPVRRLMDVGGDVLLLGVTHGSSTALHLAEWLAGRRLFVRRALTATGVREVICGGCSLAFDDVAPDVEDLGRRATVGRAILLAYPLRSYVETVRDLIRRQPEALLCGCDRCEATLKTQVIL